MLRRALQRPHDGEPPVESREPGQCRDKHVMTLSWRHGPHRQYVQPATGPARATRLRDAGHGDRDARGTDAVIGDERVPRRWTRDDDMGRMRQRHALACGERARVMRQEPRLKRQRVMHQRHRPARQDGQQVWREGTEGEAVDQQQVVRGKRAQEPSSLAQVVRRRCRKALRQSQMFDVHAIRRHPRNDLAIIGIAAGERGEISGNGEMRAHARQATAPSYQARATCDSCSVTRILAMPSPPGPSSPLRAAAAISSKIYLERNSVVVWRPANFGSASRF